jgi:peptide/nickel transport system permease protein
VLRAGHFPNPQLLVHIRHALGTDKPFWVQYWMYIRAIILHFNFGFSYQFGVSVSTLILNRLPATVSLTVGAVIVWLLIGLPIGTISAIKRQSILDRLSLGGALLAISMPVYWLGLMSLYLFANDIGVVHVFDGAGTYTGLTVSPIRWFNSLLLPWLVLAAGFAAFYSRLLRSNMVESMSEDYIRTARAKGLSERHVIFRHAARSAITPIVTLLGLDIGTLLGGAVLTETVFNIPGVGYLAYQGIHSADLPIIQGTVQLGAFFIVIANLIVDVAYAFLDPRVRYS